MKVLDLFAGVGGAGKGYADAGYEVVGVDINPQPDNPFGFTQVDALAYFENHVCDCDLHHASPPCQRYNALTAGTNRRLLDTYADLIDPVRALLVASGKPYVIENPAARADVVLCGEMFELRVIRHRRFELGGWSATAPEHKPHRGKVIGVRHGRRIVEPEGFYYAVYGNGGYKGTVPQWQDAMGIDWTDNRKSIAEAIPPAYTRYIGDQFRKWSANGR